MLRPYGYFHFFVMQHYSIKRIYLKLLNEKSNKMTIKEKVLNAVTELPQNVDFEEILERLYFLYKLETGFQQVQSGKTLTHSQAMLNLKTWHK
jgi:hypothetical protein